MEMKIDSSGGIRVARLSGDMGVGEEAVLAEKLQPLVGESESKLAIELTGMTNINSLGLSELINVVIRARLSRSRVVLVSPSHFVRGVFEVTRLDRWFEIVDDLDAAFAVLNG
mgnify:CR=1 FL=1